MNKKNLILAGLLVLLIGAAYIFQGPGKTWFEEKNKEKNILSGIKIEDADRMEVEGPSGKTSFEKQDARWKISGTKDFFLSQERYDAIVNGLKDGIIADFVVASENANKKADFGVDDKAGKKVKISQGDKVLGEFIIGKPSSDFTSVYISKLTDAKTYSLKSMSLHSAFALDEWRDTSIFSSDREKISRVRFQNKKKKTEFTVEKKDDQWNGIKPNNFKVGEGKMESVLGTMSTLTAVEIPEQKFDKAGFDKDPLIVQVTGEGVDDTIMIGNDNGKGNFYAKKGNSDNIYLISKSQKEDLDKTIAELK